MGMSEAEFFDTTPAHFMRRRRAWLDNRPGMEEARFVAFYVMQAAGAKVRRLQQIAKFPWDVVVPSVQLEDWNSPAMLEFDAAADRALAVLNPEAYAKYMEGKRNPTPGPSPKVEGGSVEGNVAHTVDPDFRLSGELNF